MIKKSIFILIFTFIFTGCAERGAVLVNKSTDTVYTSVHQTDEAVEDNNIPKLVLNYNKEEELKNKVSGSLVLLVLLAMLL